jgi:hypothetical protein
MKMSGNPYFTGTSLDFSPATWCDIFPSISNVSRPLKMTRRNMDATRLGRFGGINHHGEIAAGAVNILLSRARRV